MFRTALVLAGIAATVSHAGAANLQLTKATIEAGKLQIAGFAARAGDTIAIVGTDLVQRVRADRSFSFTANFLPPACKVTLRAPGKQLNIVIANCGPTGKTGPVGPKGEQGPRGEAGPKGDAGEKGDPGAVGERGLPGPEGPRGLTGLQGVRGLQGLRGDVGPQGIAGPIGPRGLKGDTGDFSGKIMWADVNRNGGRVESDGVASARKIQTGVYVVTFARDLEGCSVQATLAPRTNEDHATGIEARRRSITPPAPREAIVDTFGLFHEDSAFNILAVCTR